MFRLTLKKAVGRAALVALIAAAFAAVSATRTDDAHAAPSVGICLTFDCPTYTYSATQIFYGPVWTDYRGVYIVKAYDVWDRASGRYSGREDCWYMCLGSGAYFHLSFIGCWWE